MNFKADPLSRLAGAGVLHVARALSVLNNGSADLHRATLRHLGMDYPDSRALTRPIDTALRHGLSLDDMHQLGWPKLRLITCELNSSNRESLKELASKLPVEVLAHTLDLPLHDPCDHVLSLRLDAAQWTLVTRALVSHGAERAENGFIGAETALIKALGPAGWPHFKGPRQ